MNYSQVGIANLSLLRIGARGNIASVSEDSPNAIKVNLIWDMIFQEVLSERDWKFAKLRVALQQSTLTPAYGYRYAYTLPADFLRLVKPRERPQEQGIADFNLLNSLAFSGDGRSHHRDVPVWPPQVAPYVMETLSDGNKYLLTDYPATVHPVKITYIRLITDLTQLMPGFVNCLANRLASELAIPVTEDKQKAQGFMQAYRDALNSAQAQQECDDSLADESGNFNWLYAGRYPRWW